MKKPMFYLLIVVLNIIVIAASLAQESSKPTISEFEEDIQALIEKGYAMPRLEAELNQLRELQLSNDSKKAEESYQNLADLVSQAIFLEGMIEKTGSVLSFMQDRYDLGNISLDYSFGVNEFKVNNFESAEIYLEKSYTGMKKLIGIEADNVIIYLNKISQGRVGNYGLINQSLSYTVEEIKKDKREENFDDLLIIFSQLGDLNTSIALFDKLATETEKLEADGFPTDRLKDKMSIFEESISSRNYDAFLSEINVTLLLIPEIYSLNSSFSEIREKLDILKQSNIDVKEADDLLDLAVKEFDFQNYEKSREYVIEAENMITELEQKYLLNTLLAKANSKYNLLGTLKEHWLKIILSIIIGYILIKACLFFFRKNVLKKKLISLSNEKKAINTMLKKLEVEYFKNVSVDKESYLAQREKYENRTDEIVLAIPETEKKLSQMELVLDNLKNRFRIGEKKYGKTAARGLKE